MKVINKYKKMGKMVSKMVKVQTVQEKAGNIIINLTLLIKMNNC